MRKLLLAVCFAALVSPAAGQDLTLSPVGAYKIVVERPPVLLSAPEGFDLYLWSGPDGLKIKSEGRLCELSGAAGEYTVKCTGILWIIDWDKKTKDVVHKVSSMTFVIGTPGPGPKPPVPDPDPDPDPVIKPGPRFVVIVDEVQDSTVATSVMLSGLRASLGGTKHTLVVIDKDAESGDTVQPYLDRAKGKKLPYWFIVAEKGELVHEGFVPVGLTEALSEIEAHSK